MPYITGRPGCYRSARNRQTGTLTEIHDRSGAPDIDFDGKYLTSCVDHGTMIGSTTLDGAIGAAHDPRAFCDDCRDDRPLGTPRHHTMLNPDRGYPR
jgi:hypothetical protein